METVCKLGMKHTVGARQTTPPNESVRMFCARFERSRINSFCEQPGRAERGM